MRLLALPCVLLAGCIASYQTVPWISTQRYPEPMEREGSELDPGSSDEYPKGPEVVLILRYADPVHLRNAGEIQGHPLAFFDKEVRVNSGSWVEVGPGGRAEILWADSGSVVIEGNGTGIVGSITRGDPHFVFRDVDLATLNFQREARFELVGGSLLTLRSGPVSLERVRPEILCVRNQSRAEVRIAFREDVLVLDPGQAVDLPLLSAGGEPLPEEGFASVEGAGFGALVAGDAETVGSPGAVDCRARGEVSIRALGVEVALGAGERATFSGLQTPRAATASP